MSALLYALLTAVVTSSPITSEEASENASADNQESANESAKDLSNLSFDGLEMEDSLGDNLRLTLDLSTRVLNNSDTNRFFYAQFIGIDLHKVFTGPDGDWGTLVLQPYLSRIDNFSPAPGLFDSGDDWELVYRIFNFNYTGLSRGEFNIRAGHMEIPFGLEHIVTTNGTLHNYIQARNLGVKADWGVSVNGQFPSFEYEVALTRGSGNEYSSRGNPYIFAGRVGTPRSRSLSFGLSAMHGKTQTPTQPDYTMERTRFGADVIYEIESFTLLSEISFGDNQDTDLYNAIFEIDWHNEDDTWLIYNQFEVFGTDFATGWDENIINNLGVRWSPDSHWALSAQWSQDLSTYGSAVEKAIFSTQIRFRF